MEAIQFKCKKCGHKYFDFETDKAPDWEWKKVKKKEVGQDEHE